MEWLYQFGNYFMKIVRELPFTTGVIIESAVLSFVLAFPILYIRIYKVPVLSWFFEILLSFIRSMPGILELFLIYFGLPRLLGALGVKADGIEGRTFVILAMVFHYAPFLSEILRPAYLAIDKGQSEAADAVGLNTFQKNMRILLPQTLQIAIPQLGNCLTDLVKDTSLLFTIGIIDLMGKAKILINASYGRNKLEVYMAVAVCYWFLCGVSALLTKTLEKHFEHEDKTVVKKAEGKGGESNEFGCAEGSGA